MKRILNIMLLAILSAVVTYPVSAQERGRGQHNTTTTQRSHNNSGGSSRNKNQSKGNARSDRNKGNKREDKKATNGGVNRPNNGGHNNSGRPNNNGGVNRPNNGGHNNNGRPNNNGGVNRPNNGGHNNNGRPNHDNNRPNNGNNFFDRPGGNHNSIPSHNFGKPNGGNHNNRPGFGPGGGGRPTHAHHVPNHAPSRPMMPPPPPNWHYHRPAPPRHWRPGPRIPSFGTILGVTLGSAINFTVNALVNSGYYVSGYTNNAVYVNDAMMLNMMWPSTTLYYQSGRLVGSEFVYATPYYDTDRYYSTYNSLLRNYGSPVLSSNLSGGGFSSTWFGNDGRYVTLQYMSNYAADGEMRYYTTLSFGN